MVEPVDFLLCSDCFSNQGLKLSAQQIGAVDDRDCPNCHSKDGRKLTKNSLDKLTYRFFVLGTMHRTQYGAAPVLQFNYVNTSHYVGADDFRTDLGLLKKAIDARVFHYGPRLWMVGEVAPLKALQDSSTRHATIQRIIAEYPAINLNPIEIFYRIRKSPAVPANASEYDSPPQPLSVSGRIDSPSLPVLYASQDLKICIHECRATVEDELYVATLSPVRTLRLLNLNHLLQEEGITEFESLDLTVNMLFLAGSHSYEIIREIARAALSSGFDGLSYPSYFSLLHTGTRPVETQYGISNRWAAAYLGDTALTAYEQAKVIPNIALFGRPVQQGIAEVKCINRMSLRQVDYQVYFGPATY